MKLYKYKSLNDLWQILDIVINNRLYCARWHELNDPLEGHYDLLNENSANRGMIDRIDQARNKYRIASLSADSENFLLWSHYADGHKGIAIEVEIPEDHPDLQKIIYTPFFSVFSDEKDIEDDMRHLFNGKGDEWQYEKEYRIIIPSTDTDFSTYFMLPKPVTNIFLGTSIREEKKKLLRKILPETIELYATEINKTVVPFKIQRVSAVKNSQ